MKNFLYQIWCKKVLAKCNLRLPEFTLVRVGMRWSLYVNVTVAATGRNERKKMPFTSVVFCERGKRLNSKVTVIDKKQTQEYLVITLSDETVHNYI